MTSLVPPVVAGLYLLALVLFCALHASDRDVHWLSDPVSNYAVGPSGGLFRFYGHLGTVGAALLGILMARSVAPAFPSSVIASMAGVVLARIAVVLVPTDPKGQAPTRRGRLHLLLAIALFTLTWMAISDATPVLAASAWAPWLGGLRQVAMVSLALVVVTMLPPAKPFFGLVERVFLVATMAWFLVAALALWRG